MDFASLMMAEFPGIQPYNYASMSNHINTMNNQVMQQFNPVSGQPGPAFNAMNGHGQDRSNGMPLQNRQFSAPTSSSMLPPSNEFDESDANKPFQCQTCFKRFSRQGELTRHAQTHLNGQGRHLNTINTPFQCQTCYKRFSNQAQLAKHAESHFNSQNKPVSATDTLDRSFESSTVADKNKEASDEQSGEKEEEPVNSFLMMALATAREMKERQIKKERPYQCETCLKRFLSKTHLKRHLQTKTHLSGQCQQAVMVDSIPKEGTRQVFGVNGPINKPPGPDRPFSCHLCNKRFTTKNHLKRHSEIHFGVKRFSCDICHKTFLRSENLNIHKRTHSGEKPFKCSICFRGFSQPSNVKKHEKIHFNFREFQCAICLKAFKMKYNLKVHMKSMHNTIL